MKLPFFLFVSFALASLISHAQSGANSTSYSLNSNNISAHSTVSIGFNAGTVGSQSVFIGLSAGKNNTATNNMFLGLNTGNESGDSQGNVALGAYACNNCSDSDKNVYIGEGAGAYSNGAFGNISVGASTLGGNEGDLNIAIGRTAGNANKGTGNIFLGESSGFNNNTGDYNVYIGRNSARNNTGSRNVFIGDYVGKQFENVSNTLVIETQFTDATPLIFGDFISDKIGINTTSLPTSIGGQNISNYSLFVDGGLLSDEVRVRTTWADYVFDTDYQLQTIEQLESFIAQHGHLPNCPTEKEVQEQGLEIGDITRIQQEKIEELTLYIINQQKAIGDLQDQLKTIDSMKEELQQLKQFMLSTK